MATVDEALERLRYWQQEGKGALHVNHLVLIEEEAAKRGENKPDEEGRRKTRISWDAGDPDAFAEFHLERERYMRAAGSNPIIATTLIIKALQHFSDEELRRYLNSEA